MSRASTLAAFAALTLVAAGCNDDGRTLAPAPTVPVSQVTTTTAGPGSDLGGAAGPIGLTLSSPAFAEGEILDDTFTCEGLDVPPPLSISQVPPGAAEIAIVVTDRDADAYVHWVIAGIPPTVTALEAGLIPSQAVTARTTSGIDGWEGPCPPVGDAAHTYDFTVYVAAEPIGLAPDLDGDDAIAVIERAAIASDVLSVIYQRFETG